MQDTKLVQRLCEPARGKDSTLSKVHRAFGGAMVGLKEEAWDLLDPIFRIDYMGAAEFEFGIIPRTLGSLAEDNLLSGQMVVAAKDIESKMWRKNAPKPHDRTVYYLCRAEHGEQIEQRIRDLAKNKFRLKEMSYVPEALNPADEYEKKYIGWLELDNGFFFFVDEHAWRETCKLFGAEVSDVEVS